MAKGARQVQPLKIAPLVSSLISYQAIRLDVVNHSRHVELRGSASGAESA
jgi:hypothetical protein